MKRIVLIVLGVLAVSTSAYAQTTAEIIEAGASGGAAPGPRRGGGHQSGTSTTPTRR